MWSKRNKGMSLVELVVAMVIIGVGVAGVLTVFSRASVASTDPLIRKQMTALAEGLMEEIQRMPFTAQPNDPVASACARNTFNDVSDYHEYGVKQPCVASDVLGTPIPGLNAYGVQVTVGPPAVGSALFLAGGDALQIDVVVNHPIVGNYRLRGWRSNFGKLQP